MLFYSKIHYNISNFYKFYATSSNPRKVKDFSVQCNVTTLFFYLHKN